MKKTPIYKQIYNDLIEKIQNGALAQGDMLPTEKKLQETYNASRSPVRYALDLLEAKGYIKRTPGRGTEVVHPETVPWAMLSGFSEFYHNNPDKLTIRTLAVDTVNADEEVAAYFGMNTNSKVLRFKRLRLLEGRPIAYIYNYFPYPVSEGDFDISNENQSLLDLLKNILDTAEAFVQEEISAEKASEDVANVLEIKKDDPVLFVKRHGMDESKKSVEFTRYWALTEVLKYKTFFSLSEMKEFR